MRYEITETVQQVITGYLGGANRDILTAGSASIAVKDLTGTNLTVYDDDTGTGTLSNPLTADSSTGRIEGWVEAPDYDLVVSGAGITTYTQKIRLSDFVNVKSYGADTAAADNTAAINAAAAALPANGGTLVVDGRFEYTGMLDFDDTRSIVLKGAGGLSAGAGTASSLVYTGTGTRAISARSSTAFCVEDLGLFYTSGSFTGTLLDFSPSAGGGFSQLMTVNRCLLGSGGTTVQTARLLDLDDAYVGNFTSCHFAGSDVAVRGKASSGNNSNVMRFSACQFNFTKTVHVKNAHQSWVFSACNFEQLYNGATSAGAAAYTQDSGHQALGLTFQGCWFGDATAAGSWIDFAGGGGLVVQGCYFTGGAKAVALSSSAATGGVVITGNVFDTLTTAFDSGSGNNSIDYFGNVFNSVTNEVVHGTTKPVGSRIHSPAAGDTQYSSSIHLYNPANPPVIVMYERTDPGASPANGTYVFLVDNGAGKTLAKARFASGAAQTFATEP